MPSFSVVFVTMETLKLTVIQPALLRYYGNAIKLIVTQHTQQELLRYYGNLICHNRL
jgi:hypothetical protein